MNPVIKICGITREEDVLLCKELGIEMIGLNFVLSSPRCVSVDRAKELRSYAKECKVIGIFKDASEEEMQKVIEEVGLDGIQLHGEADGFRPSEWSVVSGQSFDEAQESWSVDDLIVIKAFRFTPEESVIREWMDAGARILLDGRANGEQADLEAIAALPEDIRSQMILAGGLTPENVQEAIEQVYPWGIDVASGVESELGIKSEERVREFIKKVKSEE